MFIIKSTILYLIFCIFSTVGYATDDCYFGMSDNDDIQRGKYCSARNFVKDGLVDSILNSIKDLRELRSESPDLFDKKLYEIFTPLIHKEFLSKLILGKHFKKASKSQIKEFSSLMVLLMSKTYGGLLVSLGSIDVKFKGESVINAGNIELVTVKTLVHLITNIHNVDFILTFDDKSKNWKLIDIRIDGTSLTAQWRSSFGRELDEVGLEGLLVRLRGLLQKFSLY